MPITPVLAGGRNRAVRLRPLPPFFASFALGVTMCVGETPDPIVRLQNRAGATVRMDIAAGRTRLFAIFMKADEFAQISLHQVGIDLATTVRGSDRQVVQTSDWRWSGAETISWIARSSGEYRIEVLPRRGKGASGKLTLSVSRLRRPTASDSNWMEAERLLTEIKEGLGNPAQRTRHDASLRKALELWRELKHDAGVAQTLNIRGFLEEASGNPAAAMESYRSALAFRSGIDLAGEGETLHNMAAAESVTGDKVKARALYRQALELRRREGDLEGKAATLSNLGGAYLMLGQVDEAIGALEEAVAANRSVASIAGETQARINLGVAYGSVGEPEAAMEQFQAALGLARLDVKTPGYAYALTNLGKLYGDFADFERARSMLDRALTSMQARRDRRGEALVLANLGVIRYMEREPAAAIPHLIGALEIFRGIPDRFSEGHVVQRLSRAHLAMGEMDPSIRYNREALALAKSLGDVRGEAAALRNSGAIDHARRAWPSAIESLNESKSLFERIRNRDGEADALLALANVYFDAGDSRAALAQVEDALRLIESQRSKVASNRLRGSYFASRRTYYDLYIDLLMKLHRENAGGEFAAAALLGSERGRARLLLDTIPLARIALDKAVDPALAARKRNLHREINRSAHDLQTGTLSGKALTEVNQGLDRRLSELDDVQAQIFKIDPKYRELIAPLALTISELQSQLDSETELIEYYLGENGGLAWLVTTGKVTAFTGLPSRAETEDLVRTLYQSVTERGRRVPNETRTQRNARLNVAAAMYRKTAGSLSEKLLGPVAGQFSAKRVVIVADGALQFLPFGALPLPGDSSGTPLVARHEVLSLPSLGALAAIRRATEGRPPPPEQVAVIADPVFSPNDPRVLSLRTGGASGPRGTDDFPRLIHSRHEARAIQALVPGSSKVILDFEANVKAALDPALGSYSILHFSTHGILDSVRPSLSALVLSLVDESGLRKDGFLRLHEIYNLKLPVDLVVLSACQTAMGKEILGEGLESLMRGFMHAGAPRVVASLWRVDDEATSELMKTFYKGVLGKSGKNHAGALRQAQMRMMSDPRWSDPYFWAAFVPVGDWR
ncbi:MAG: CHAT domain-containing protein [Bryobacteraceae bacterium]